MTTGMIKKPLHLFDACGVEMEYMIVDRETLDIKPFCDRVLEKIAGHIVNEWPNGKLAVSNELVLHVIEIKTNGPAASLLNLDTLFQDEVRNLNGILEEMNCCLMPGPMHPWMNPYTDMKLWPHEYNPIYEAYDRIFNCKGHGWSNLQSTHLNLPFFGDEEFGKLHAASRILLPLIPAMAAASPLADETAQPFMDYRMEVYRTNSKRIPSITGLIVPEQVFTEADYNDQIFQRMYDDISVFDPDGILQDEWLNSRGAMARFDRGAIEIRVVDIQECPAADIAIAEWITACTRALVNEEWCSLEDQKKWHEEELFEILKLTIRDAERARITNPGFLRLFGIDGRNEMDAGFLCQELYSRLESRYPFSDCSPGCLRYIFEKGTLSRRLLHSLPQAFTKKDLHQTYDQLCGCLRDGKQFEP